MKYLKSIPLLDGLKKTSATTKQGKTNNLFSFGSLISSQDKKAALPKTDKARPTSFFIPIKSKKSVQKSTADVNTKSTSSTKPVKIGEMDELVKMMKEATNKTSNVKKIRISPETESGVIAALNLMHSNQDSPKKLNAGIRELSEKVSLSYKKNTGMHVLLNDPKEVKPAQDFLKELNVIAKKRSFKLPQIKISAHNPAKQEGYALSIKSGNSIRVTGQVVPEVQKGTERGLFPDLTSVQTKEKPEILGSPKLDLKNAKPDNMQENLKTGAKESSTTIPDKRIKSASKISVEQQNSTQLEQGAAKTSVTQKHAESTKPIQDQTLRSSDKDVFQQQNIISDKKVRISVSQEEVTIQKGKGVPKLPEIASTLIGDKRETLQSAKISSN